MAKAETALTVSVEPVRKGFLRAAFGWVLMALSAMGFGFPIEPTALLRVRTRSDNRIVHEQRYSGAFQML